MEASAVYKDTNLPIDEHCRYKDFFVIDDFIFLQFFVLKELFILRFSFSNLQTTVRYSDTSVVTIVRASMLYDQLKWRMG